MPQRFVNRQRIESHVTGCLRLDAVVGAKRACPPAEEEIISAAVENIDVARDSFQERGVRSYVGETDGASRMTSSMRSEPRSLAIGAERHAAARRSP